MPKWTPVLETIYSELRGRLAGPSTWPQSDTEISARLLGLPRPEINLYLRLRFARLCAFLRQREPDDNIGYSILIYRLSDRDVQQALTGKAVELVPECPENLRRLADECFRAGIWSAAAICYEAMLKRGPMPDRQATAEAFDRWGSALMSLRRPAEAVAILRKGLHHAPEHAKMNNNLAWLLATTRADAQRDGAEALRRAKAALESAPAQDPEIYDTLAAAYAELEQFEDACRSADIAIRLARELGLADLVPQITARLELYRSGKPFREP
jgi:tetratricopeptide (TPR) repeat protein